MMLRSKGSPKRWSSDELIYLRQVYGHVRVEDMELDRTRPAITKKVSELNLRRQTRRAANSKPIRALHAPKAVPDELRRALWEFIVDEVVEPSPRLQALILANHDGNGKSTMYRRPDARLQM